MVAFLAKLIESKGFKHIIDFLNANPIKYDLMVNPTIYTSCIEQFWAAAKAKNINGEAQIHAKVDGKKVVISKATTRRDLKFEYKGGVNCLSNEVIFNNLHSWDKQVDGISKHNAIYVVPSHTKKVFRNMERIGKGFFGRDTSLFPTMRQDTIGDTISQTSYGTVSKHFNDPPLSRVNTLESGEDVLKLNELIELYTKLSKRVLILETTKTVQAQEISSLKKRVKRLEKKRSLGEKDASKQGRKIADIDDDKGITLVDKTTEDQKQKPKKIKRKDTKLPQTSSPKTNIADKVVNEEMDDSLERAATTTSSLEADQDSSNINKTQSKATLNEPSSIGTSSDNKKTTQELEIDSLKRRVKKLEKKQRLRTHELKRLYKVSLTARVDSFDEVSLGEDASKQERIIDDIDVDE
nr:hypothetical protein [Tanacetum cinerariifolium]